MSKPLCLACGYPLVEDVRGLKYAPPDRHEDHLVMICENEDCAAYGMTDDEAEAAQARWDAAAKEAGQDAGGGGLDESERKQEAVE